MKQFKVGDVVVFEDGVMFPKEVLTLKSFNPESGRWIVEETDAGYLQDYIRHYTKLDEVLK